MTKKTKIIISFIISFLWVSLGTIIPILKHFSYNCTSFIYDFLGNITFPFNLILNLSLIAADLGEANLSEASVVLLIIIQSIKVFIYWWLIYKIMMIFTKKHNQINS